MLSIRKICHPEKGPGAAVALKRLSDQEIASQKKFKNRGAIDCNSQYLIYLLKI
jgi:hypothetical protein